MSIRTSFLLITYSLGILLFSQQPGEFQIFQTETRIVIDGNLDDWSAIAETPIQLRPGGSKLEPSGDLAVTAKFSFDAENFYVAVKAEDNQFEFPERSWRYGDGFYLTFTDPYSGEKSNRFLSLGFSLEGKQEAKVVVNRDGEYFPRVSVKDIKVRINKDSASRVLTYEVSIPWKYLPAFRPFIHQKWGINLIYVDKDGPKRKIVQLYPDLNYDTELSANRKGRLCRFIPRLPQNPEFQVALTASRFWSEEKKNLLLGVCSASAQEGWELSYSLSPAEVSEPVRQDFSFQKGMNILEIPLETGNQPSGLYDLSLGIRDDQRVLRFSEDKQFFQLSKKDLEDLRSRLETAKKRELFAKDTAFRESLPTLEIRLEWIEELMAQPSPFIDVDLLCEWHRETKELSMSVDKGKPALFPAGQIARLAHRSEIDETLQPYSVFIPDEYNPKKPLPLLVTLHGSGVDERRTIASLVSVHEELKVRRMAGDFIILAPKARGLSDWYIGDAGREVLECIDHIKKLYRIDEKNIILDGFSMGGYGAWRLALLNPRIFKAVIIRSGRTSPPGQAKRENILDLLDKGKGLNFLVVHGDQDQAAPVEGARKAVERMKELGMKYKYIEVKEKGHGDYDKWEEIFGWLKDVVGQKKR